MPFDGRALRLSQAAVDEGDDRIFVEASHESRVIAYRLVREIRHLSAACSDEQLIALCDRGRAAFPQLPLECDVFAAHLIRVASAGEEETRPALDALAIEDLYLACACIHGTSGAAEQVRDRHGRTIDDAIGRIARGRDAGEIAQQLLHDILVGSPHSGPKIALYGGRAPLDRWLQVAAQRAALGWVRGHQMDQRVRDAVAKEPQAKSDPELGYLKDRYRGEFEDAMKRALEGAPDRERALLRLHLVNGLTVDKIGKMYGVSQPTASRWLAAAREYLLEQVKNTLAERIGASPEEIASLAGLVASRLDLSLSRLLKPR
jgi:RNA polymerase sigma-70 factor, ECF subfamily